MAVVPCNKWLFWFAALVIYWLYRFMVYLTKLSCVDKNEWKLSPQLSCKLMLPFNLLLKTCTINTLIVHLSFSSKRVSRKIYIYRRMKLGKKASSYRHDWDILFCNLSQAVMLCNLIDESQRRTRTHLIHFAENPSWRFQLKKCTITQINSMLLSTY